MKDWARQSRLLVGGTTGHKGPTTLLVHRRSFQSASASCLLTRREYIYTTLNVMATRIRVTHHVRLPAVVSCDLSLYLLLRWSYYIHLMTLVSHWRRARPVKYLSVLHHAMHDYMRFVPLSSHTSYHTNYITLIYTGSSICSGT
jgi:hypothetical protein